MPKLSAIANYWGGLPVLVQLDVFPEMRARWIGWGEPFCFRCGWLAPVPDAAAVPFRDPRTAIAKAWDRASGWLERAHLQDHALGGSADASNLVPLCPLCHEDQPMCKTRAEAIAFVNTPSRAAALIGVQQVYTDTFYRSVRRPSAKRAHRALLRARAFIGEQLAAQVLTDEHDHAGTPAGSL